MTVIDAVSAAAHADVTASGSPTLAGAAQEFSTRGGYLAACTSGIAPRRTVAALRRELDSWASGERDAGRYDGVVARTRQSYARLVGVEPARVAIGSQTSVLVSLLAAAVPRGAEVLLVDGDFSSIHFPFVQRAERGEIVVRSAPLEGLADAVTDATWAVAFSLIQSASGDLADAAAIRQAAIRHGALTLCDTTQAAGVLPLDAGLWDATVCHAYKWLCAPRGAAFLTLSQRMQDVLQPHHAGWFAGEDVWGSCYGPSMALATDARRFDVSPAWEAWVGAEQSVGLFADLDLDAVWAHASGLGDALCDGLGIPQQHRAIVTWRDPSGADLAALTEAGLVVSGRAGRVRAAFHLWNTADDVAAAVGALRA